MCLLRSLLFFALFLSSSLIISANGTGKFLYDLQSQCPPLVFQKLLAVGGDFIDVALNTGKLKGYTSILFHASWCPFSRKLFGEFETLSFMFPNIEHLTVEESASLPSVFSSNGIHSLPSIIVANQTAKFWYHGAKNLDSISKFYERKTGQKPIKLNFGDSMERENSVEQRGKWPSMEEEPYLVFAVMFVVVRVMVLFAPSLHHHVRALHMKYTPQFKVEAMLERGFHMVDVRRMWAKIRVGKITNFHEKAKSCRLWASSLASVSSSGRL